MTFDGFEGDIELPKLNNGEFFGHFDELDGRHFLDVTGKYRVTIQLVQNLLLTSKPKFRFGLVCPGLARPKRNFCF